MIVVDASEENARGAATESEALFLAMESVVHRAVGIIMPALVITPGERVPWRIRLLRWWLRLYINHLPLMLVFSRPQSSPYGWQVEWQSTRVARAWLGVAKLLNQ